MAVSSLECKVTRFLLFQFRDKARIGNIHNQLYQRMSPQPTGPSGGEGLQQKDGAAQNDATSQDKTEVG